MGGDLLHTAAICREEEHVLIICFGVTNVILGTEDAYRINVHTVCLWSGLDVTVLQIIKQIYLFLSFVSRQ